MEVEYITSYLANPHFLFYMKQLSFAQRMNLRQGDVVIVPKSIWNVVAHYIVYWGYFNGQDYYLENNHDVGVRWINETFFYKENPIFKRIRYFQGGESERELAIQRATSLLGNSYDLKKFNCENYANYVQYGVSYSKQIDSSKELIFGGLALGLVVLVAAGLTGK